MALDRKRTLSLVAAAVMAGFGSAYSPAAAGTDNRIGFCPAEYKLWGALCMNASTGDVVRPETSGPAYAQRKAETMGLGLCAAWDVHITTQIGDFGVMGTLPAGRLEKAGLLQALARAL